MQKPTLSGALARDRCGMSPVSDSADDTNDENKDNEDDEGGESGSPTALPLRLLVSLLRERFGRTDCSEGVVLHGLQESQYVRNMTAMSHVLKVVFGPTSVAVEGGESGESGESGEGEGKDEGKDEEVADAAPPTDLVYAVLDDEDLDAALSPSLLAQQEAGKAKGGDPEVFAAALEKRTDNEKAAFDLAMSLPVGSGMLRVRTNEWSSQYSRSYCTTCTHYWSQD